MFELFPVLGSHPRISGFVCGAFFTLTAGLLAGVVYSGEGVFNAPKPVPQVYFF